MKKSKTKNSSDEIIMNLPEVSDIPGQENIKPPNISEMQDMTISSADEEGDELFRSGDDILGDEFDETTVSDEEKKMLSDAAAFSANGEEQELRDAVVDNRDEDGELLNENVSYKDLGAKDLDIPDDFEDDDDEELGKN